MLRGIGILGITGTVLATIAIAPAAGATGHASLRKPPSCTAAPFEAVVSGTQIANVSFFVDREKTMTVISPDSRGRFTHRIGVAKLKPGRHRLRAYVTFEFTSGTPSRTIKRSFSRCAVAQPRFTG